MLDRRQKKTRAAIFNALQILLEKKPYIVPIPGSRNLNRLRENALAADIRLTASEIKTLDQALDTMNMTVFSGVQNTQAQGK